MPSRSRGPDYSAHAAWSRLAPLGQITVTGIPALREHLAAFVNDGPGALVFAGETGMPLRRSNFNKMPGWPHAVESIGAAGLHVHDLRHTGNQFGCH